MPGRAISSGLLAATRQSTGRAPRPTDRKIPLLAPYTRWRLCRPRQPTTAGDREIMSPNHPWTLQAKYSVQRTTRCTAARPANWSENTIQSKLRSDQDCQVQTTKSPTFPLGHPVRAATCVVDGVPSQGAAELGHARAVVCLDDHAIRTLLPRPLQGPAFDNALSRMAVLHIQRPARHCAAHPVSLARLPPRP